MTPTVTPTASGDAAQRGVRGGGPTLTHVSSILARALPSGASPAAEPGGLWARQRAGRARAALPLDFQYPGGGRSGHLLTGPIKGLPPRIFSPGACVVPLH